MIPNSKRLKYFSNSNLFFLKKTFLSAKLGLLFSDYNFRSTAMASFVEWEITNFSCWNRDFHGETLRKGGCELRPGGKGQHLTVIVSDSCIKKPDGELSFIGSDGTVICTRQPDDDSGEDRISYTGPKFDEVVSEIRKKEPLMHNDKLILRWTILDGFMPERYKTVIHAFYDCFLIEPEMLDFNNWKAVNDIALSSRDGNDGRIHVSARKTDSKGPNSKVKFKLKSEGVVENVLVQASIWLSNENHKTVSNDCVLLPGHEYVLPFEITFRPQNQTAIFCKCFLKLREEKSQKSENAVTVLAKDFKCLYQDQNFSDYELRCGTVSFPTHRSILSARSPVFKAMLSGDMREAECGHMDVEDLDPHTLGRFLSFLYSGGTGETLKWEAALKLYYAADKYQVPSLKEECAEVLCKCVVLENVCDILLLADRHNDESLRSVAHTFILENYNELLGSEDWKKLMTIDSFLVAKTLSDLGVKDNVKISVTNS